ncbi:argininosuccinate lyase [Candidatus Micrarchaeota archaeon]|nr:argininosuccinate lyase [Candidatus Micrarchaeota archaeon]
MKKMLWGGAFEKAPKDAVLEYMSKENAELDSYLIKYDILGSLAHVKMLGEQKILAKNEAEEISKSLKQVLYDYENGKFKLDIKLEDVHMNVESAVSAITPFGKKMHTARSRNDQVNLDMRLLMRDALLDVAELIIKLQKAFAGLAKKDFAMPAYTHTRVAQPITVSFWCESYVQSLERDIERIFDAYKRVNKSPLGACAISGTSWNINRKYTAELLGFESVLENEMDAIGSRGEMEAEVLFIFAELMAKLSRFAEEIIWFSEKGMVVLDDAYSTGSSIMPNKKNPDVLELVKGRCGRVYGNLVHVLTVQKGLMGGHNADTQETKFAVMSASDIVKQSLGIMGELVPGLEFDEEEMKEELKKGYANATELADLLAMNGIPFREAHEKVGKMVAQLAKQGRHIEDMNAEEINAMLGVELSSESVSNAIAFKKERLSRKVSVDEKWEKMIKEKQEKIVDAFNKLL